MAAAVAAFFLCVCFAFGAEIGRQGVVAGGHVSLVREENFFKATHTAVDPSSFARRDDHVVLAQHVQWHWHQLLLRSLLA